jgi:hypothetical protein
MKHLSIVCAALLAALACGCEAQPAPRAPVAAPEAPAMTRDLAIRTARYDAISRFGDGWIAWQDAQKLGRYWVVELRSQNGRGLRYSIASDGSIRERNTVQ